MGVIATLLPNADQLQRVRVAIRDRHEILVCDDWPSLARACERRPVRLALIDIFAGGQAHFDRVRQLKRRLPRLTLIAYVTFEVDRAHDLFDAGRQGMDALVIAGQNDTPRALLGLIDLAESRNLAMIVRQSVAGMDPVAVDALLVAVTRAHERPSPDRLARLVALPRRTVSSHLLRAGFPSPRRLLTWGRLIVAAHMLEEPHRSAQRVASALEFPSGSAFRNTCQRYLHAAPHEIRSRGGASYVIRAMLAQLQRASGASGASSSTGRRARNLSLAI
jgi:AraC-like DNA-binding protein